MGTTPAMMDNAPSSRKSDNAKQTPTNHNKLRVNKDKDPKITGKVIEIWHPDWGTIIYNRKPMT